LGSLQQGCRAHDGYCGGIWILCSAGRPCLNPMIMGAHGPCDSVF
jgi:hypothetical protein